jgi:uncharacterized DUF497 family protein
MDIAESMGQYGLRRDNREDCRRYAILLEEGRVKPLPQDLAGLQVSRNRKCQWFKKKAFINQWKHQISFERVSHLFEDPLPPGFEIVYVEEDPAGDEKQYEYYQDYRDRMLVKIDPKHYVVVKVDMEHTTSGLVHLVSARYANTAAVQDALRKRSISGSVQRFRDILGREDFDYFGSLPRYAGDVTRFVFVYSSFMNNDISVPDAVDMLETEFGIALQEAESVVQDWLYKRNVKVLSELMRGL